MNLRPINLRRDVRAILGDCARRHLTRGARVYDVGCGSKPLGPALSQLSCLHVGIDMDHGFYGNEAVDIIGVADALPVAGASGDALLSSQVIEHLADPERAMAEAGRVLKPGGLLFISFPLVYPLHAAPHDYFRYSRYGFEAMCRRHGFEIVETHEMAGFWYMTSIFTERYAGVFDRSFARRLRLVAIALYPAQCLFRLLHGAETVAFRLLGKNAGNSRQAWTVNYVFVARRTAR